MVEAVCQVVEIQEDAKEELDMTRSERNQGVPANEEDGEEPECDVKVLKEMLEEKINGDDELNNEEGNDDDDEWKECQEEEHEDEVLVTSGLPAISDVAQGRGNLAIPGNDCEGERKGAGQELVEEEQYYEVPETEGTGTTTMEPETECTDTTTMDKEQEYTGTKRVMKKTNRTLLARMVMMLMGIMAAAQQAKQGPVMWVSESVQNMAETSVSGKGAIHLGTERGREAMWDLVTTKEPYMLVLKPPCEKLFAGVKEDKANYTRNLMESIGHVKTCV